MHAKYECERCKLYSVSFVNPPWLVQTSKIRIVFFCTSSTTLLIWWVVYRMHLRSFYFVTDFFFSAKKKKYIIFVGCRFVPVCAVFQSTKRLECFDIIIVLLKCRSVSHNLQSDHEKSKKGHCLSAQIYC